MLGHILRNIEVLFADIDTTFVTHKDYLLFVCFFPPQLALLSVAASSAGCYECCLHVSHKHSRGWHSWKSQHPWMRSSTILLPSLSRTSLFLWFFFSSTGLDWPPSWPLLQVGDEKLGRPRLQLGLLPHQCQSSSSGLSSTSDTSCLRSSWSLSWSNVKSTASHAEYQPSPCHRLNCKQGLKKSLISQSSKKVVWVAVLFFNMWCCRGVKIKLSIAYHGVAMEDIKG